MKDRELLKHVFMFFLLLWVVLTMVFGGVMLGLNVIVPVVSTLRLFIGTVSICFAVSVALVIANYQDIVDNYERTIGQKR